MSQVPTKTELKRLPELGELEWLYAQRQTQCFPKHTHERYAIGVIERGALEFYYRGENLIASAGDINLCIPGEVHTGQPAVAEGWTYRMFYFDTYHLEEVMRDITKRSYGLPFFVSGIIQDPALASRLRALHICLGESSSKLERETALLSVLAQLVSRHADVLPTLHWSRREEKAVLQVKRYIEAHFAEDIPLTTLSQLTGLSRYHLVRVFKNTVGIPPHAYLRQVRISQAKARLRRGESVAQVAVATGFADQSHLTRWFKRFWGFTPGHYRNSVQDKPS